MRPVSVTRCNVRRARHCRPSIAGLLLSLDDLSFQETAPTWSRVGATGQIQSFPQRRRRPKAAGPGPGLGPWNVRNGSSGAARLERAVHFASFDSSCKGQVTTLVNALPAMFRSLQVLVPMFPAAVPLRWNDL
jgi:hypothetical protein